MENYYVNFIQIRSSFFDFTLTLNRVSEVKEGPDGSPEPVVETQARVQMSPQHAKSLLQALQSNVDTYEEKFGKIQMPAAGAESDDRRQAQ